MDRCPNCDAAVRPNAKFCTSCGFRLPNPEPVLPVEPTDRPEGWRSPFSTTSHYETNQSWTAPVPPPPAPEPPAPVVPDVPAAVVAAAEDPAPAFAGWPNFLTSTIPADGPVDAEVGPTEDASTVEAPADASALEPVAATNLQEDQPSGEEQPQVESPVPASDDGTIATERPGEHVHIATKSLPEVGENPADNPTEPIPALAASAKSDLVHRALGLVDELRSLIPNLRPSGGSAPSGDPGDAIDLVSRAGAIEDLLEERDRYVAAIKNALTALGNSPE